jgi:SAM-dependent methyltransferase
MENNQLKETYESNNPLTRTYFRMKIWLTIRLAKIKKTDIILDFGCGGGWLEKKLQNYKIYGYDINPDKTFIKDYRQINPNKIFVLDVLEHMPKKEIENIIFEFKKLNDCFDLIVSVPTENWLSKKIRRFVGKTEVPKEHITKQHEILGILERHFKLKKKINFFTVSNIFLFEYGMK